MIRNKYFVSGLVTDDAELYLSDFFDNAVEDVEYTEVSSVPGHNDATAIDAILVSRSRPELHLYADCDE